MDFVIHDMFPIFFGELISGAEYRRGTLSFTGTDCGLSANSIGWPVSFF